MIIKGIIPRDGIDCAVVCIGTNWCFNFIQSHEYAIMYRREAAMSILLQIFYKTYPIFFFTLHLEHFEHTVYCMRTFCDTFAPFLKLECGRCSLPYECKQDIFLVQPWTSLPNQNWQAGPPSIVLWPQARLSANR